MNLDFVKVNKEEYYIYKEITDLSNVGHFYLLKQNNMIIGFGKINNDDYENKIEIYILTEYRGNGYGKMLFGNLLDELKNENIPDISVFIDTTDIVQRKIVEDFKGILVCKSKDKSKSVTFFNPSFIILLL